MVSTILGDMSAGNENAGFFTRTQREAVLRGLFTNYYDPLGRSRTVFDTNRGWTTRIDPLGDVVPAIEEMICCVQYAVKWIIDSIERLIRKNTSELSKIFSFDAGGTVYSQSRWADEPDGA